MVEDAWMHSLVSADFYLSAIHTLCSANTQSCPPSFVHLLSISHTHSTVCFITLLDLSNLAMSLYVLHTRLTDTDSDSDIP